jgi:hypothetical protein
VGVAGPVETGKSQQVPILKFLDTQNQDGSYTYGYEVRILEWSFYTYGYEARILEWSLCRWFRFAQLAKGKKFRP